MTGLCYALGAGDATNTQLKGQKWHMNMSVSEPILTSPLSYLVLGWLMFFLWRYCQADALLSAT